MAQDLSALRPLQGGGHGVAMRLEERSSDITVGVSS